MGEHLVAVGLEHINLRRSEDQDFTGSFASITSAQAKERQSIAWVQDEWKVLPSTTLTYGVRGESIALDSEGPRNSRGCVMPSLAVRWEPVDGG